MAAELYWLYAGLGLYSAATAAAIAVVLRRSAYYSVPLAILGLAMVVHGIAIAIRWDRLDHGPYVNLFEILSSNVFSLHAAILAGCLLIPRIRPALAAALPVLQILVIWLFVTEPVQSELPVTYQTVWLSVHVWLGKLFLGCTLVALSVSLVVLLRRVTQIFEVMPNDQALDELIYRAVFFAFILDSMMLVAGAVWAQDAWGRYWAWDPLETWSFVTWLAIVAYLHLRVTRRPSPPVGATIVVAIFIIAFWTFFGIPFVSTAPHKGAI